MSWWTTVPAHVFIRQATFIPSFGFRQMVDGSSFVPEVGEVTGNVKTLNTFSCLTNNLLDISKWLEQNQLLVSSINLGFSSQWHFWFITNLVIRVRKGTCVLTLLFLWLETVPYSWGLVTWLNLLLAPFHNSPGLMCCVHMFSLNSPVEKFTAHICESSWNTWMSSKHWMVFCVSGGLGNGFWYWNYYSFLFLLNHIIVALTLTFPLLKLHSRLLSCFLMCPH